MVGALAIFIYSCIHVLFVCLFVFWAVPITTQLNTGQTLSSERGRDINVEPVWLQGITGCNSSVAIVDDGLCVCACVCVCACTDYICTSFLLPGVDYNHGDLQEQYVSYAVRKLITYALGGA